MVETTSFLSFPFLPFPSLPSPTSILHLHHPQYGSSTYYTRGSSHLAKVEPNRFLGFQRRENPHNPSFPRTLCCSRSEFLNYSPYLLHLGFFPESSIWNLLLHFLQRSLPSAVLHHTDIPNLTYLSLVTSFSLSTFANLRESSLSMETLTTLIPVVDDRQIYYGTHPYRRCVGVELQQEKNLSVNQLRIP
ncbi:unnamed protein product [Penicillium nalgiovense]|nr:unnamed protein product [Penicillium nalgiovense]